MILKSWCKPHLHHVFENPETTKNEQISQISKFTNFAEIKILKWKIVIFTASSCTLRYVFLRGILCCVLCSCSFHAAVARYIVERISTLRKSVSQHHRLNSALLDNRPQKSFSFAMDRNECVTCYRWMVMKRWMMMWIQPLLN